MTGSRKGRVLGCLFGAAYGDSLGAATEFIKVDEILCRFPPNGPDTLTGHPARVTDDTQMMVAVGEALLKAAPDFSREQVEPAIVEAFIAWMNHPDNTRAPGITCMTACEKLDRGQPWQQASQISSKGCGTVMRVQPVGILDVDPEHRAALAQFQAVVTHGHPTGLAAADLTAYTIAALLDGAQPVNLPSQLRDYANTQRRIYHHSWLDELWQRAIIFPEAADYIEHGWNEVLGKLDKLDTALANPDRENDPCLQTGAGWIAEEAFATALLCFLLFPDDPVAAIRRAAVTSGDSDSIAAICGAFAGACHAIDGWPAAWHTQIEYHERLESVADLGST